MKRIWMMMAAAAVMAWGQEAKPAAATTPAMKVPAKGAPKKKTVAAKPAVKKEDPMAIPAGAKEVEPGTFRLMDSKGQAWLYRKTPFGTVKMLEKPESAAAVEVIPSDWTAKEEGDSVTFERPNPFGKASWTKKKTELSDVEAAVFKRAQGASK